MSLRFAGDRLRVDGLGTRAGREVLGVAHRLCEHAADALGEGGGLGRTGDQGILHGAQEGQRRAGEVRRCGLALGVQLEEGEHAELKVPGGPHEVLLAVDILALGLERPAEELVDAEHGLVVHAVRGVGIGIGLVVVVFLERASLDERSLDRRSLLLVQRGVVLILRLIPGFRVGPAKVEVHGVRSRSVRPGCLVGVGVRVAILLVFFSLVFILVVFTEGSAVLIVRTLSSGVSVVGVAGHDHPEHVNDTRLTHRGSHSLERVLHHVPQQRRGLRQ